MNTNINDFKKAIEKLVLEGFVILQIIQPDGGFLYFNVYKWTEGYFNTAQSIDFNTVEGVDITDFLRKNSALVFPGDAFISQFNKVMEEGTVIRCEFSKESIWYKWSAAGR